MGTNELSTNDQIRHTNNRQARSYNDDHLYPQGLVYPIL